jgi:hypothetical protein
VSTVPPIRREILVDADPAAAFEMFTAGLGRWWPLEELSVYGKGATVAFADGQIVERSADGEAAVWGTVTRWEPPVAVAFTWHPAQPADRASHVEVRRRQRRDRVPGRHRPPVAGHDGGMTSLPRPIKPTLIRPMLASLRHELPADEESYGWELKWDGLRAIAYVSGEEVRLVSRNDKDMAPSYPELGVLAERVSTPVILDGEIVTLRDGRPDFGLLQSRMHVQQPEDKLLRRAPVQYYVFDLLHQGQDSLLGLPYTQRRARLEALGLDAAPVRTPP